MTLDQLLSKAFNGKAENIVISKNIIMFHLDGVETRINLVSFINQIYNDHEGQLKAKDKEIERLKADCELNGLRMFRQGVNSQKKADIGWLKARSIVAMLFWRAKKDKRLADEENRFFTYDMALHSFTIFRKAYKMLSMQMRIS